MGQEFPDEPLLTHHRCIVARTYAHSLIVRGFQEQVVEQIRRAEMLFEKVEPRLGEDNFYAKREEVWILVTRFEIFDQLKEFEQAESSLRRADTLVRDALQAYPAMEGYARDSVMIKKKLAKHYERQGRDLEAEICRLEFSDAYLKLADLAPYDANALNDAAWYLLVRDEITAAEASRALKLVELSLQRDPNSSSVHNTIGLALFRNGMLDRSIHHFHEALRLKNTVGARRLNHALLAMVYDQQGNVDAAIQSARIVQQLADAKPIAPDHQKFLARAIGLLPAS